MKRFFKLLLLLPGYLFFSQNIGGIQLFNPNTNDETPVIGFDGTLILRFDDLSARNNVYRYTIKHFNRNWEEDGLFFTEYAKGNLNDVIDNLQYSFNTYQKYTHYELTFPNKEMQPIISGNFELVVYHDSPEKPLFKKRFCVVEDGADLSVKVSRMNNAKNPEINQRVQVQAVADKSSLVENMSTLSLSVIQNNNWNIFISGLKPSSSLNNRLIFQQLNLSFPGNNEFYYFNNRTLGLGYDMIAKGSIEEGQHHTYLFPVWAYPLNYQYQPDVNGSYFFRRTDLTIERNAEREGDYSWVHFYLPSDPVDKKIYVLGGFNDYLPTQQNQMFYNEEKKVYEAKIYLKQGFYNYILATQMQDGKLNFGEINGNFWQAENLYQAFLYYRPFNRNYDGILGYGEYRMPVRQ
ncbi:MAG: DUF5103 domain-containing protein [Bergeyella sp.]|nr:DUF5103 domain-containing protein [Bergeyella sp.]